MTSITAYLAAYILACPVLIWALWLRYVTVMNDPRGCHCK